MGVLVSALSLAVVASKNEEDLIGVMPWEVGVVLGISMAFGFLLYRSRQYAGIAHARTPATDARPAVLYLRSFSRDLTALKGAWALLQSPAVGTMEEQLREALAPIGPLIAVGLPGESLPPPGAQRVYLDDEEWRTKVEALMASAALVIILVGRGGAGLGWEVQRAFDRVDRSRLLLLVMKGRKEYERACEGIEREAAIKLPPYRKVNRTIWPSWLMRAWFMRANCFLAFPTAGNEVTVLLLRAPWLRDFGSLTAEARYALRPIFERLGVRWSPTPISTANIIVVAIVVSALVVMLLVP